MRERSKATEAADDANERYRNCGLAEKIDGGKIIIRHRSRHRGLGRFSAIDSSVRSKDADEAPHLAPPKSSVGVRDDCERRAWVADEECLSYSVSPATGSGRSAPAPGPTRGVCCGVQAVGAHRLHVGRRYAARRNVAPSLMIRSGASLTPQGSTRGLTLLLFRRRGTSDAKFSGGCLTAWGAGSSGRRRMVP
jgi:hypothetical protein